MIYPTEVVMQQIRQDLEREVAQRNLAKLAREGQPTLWQRLNARFNVAQSRTTPQSDQQPSLLKDRIALSR